MEWLGYRMYAEARAKFTWDQRWKVFDGTKNWFNIAHECIDRHRPEDVALRIKFADRRVETYRFGELQRLTSKFARFLERIGVGFGDRVAVMLFPSLEFYVSMFGTMKRGAVVVPCFPLFGPDALSYRLEASGAKAIVLEREKIDLLSKEHFSRLQVVLAEELLEALAGEAEEYHPATSAADVAMIQFSSGTTGTPKSVVYRHDAVTVAAPVVEFGVGVRPDDEYYCPSSPAWGHGIWYGTIGPLIFGKAIGAYSGKFDAEVCLEALEEFGITNMSAISSHYRLITECEKLPEFRLRLRRITYTGEPMARDLVAEIQEKLGLTPHCLYGTTEAGPLTLDYAFEDWVAKPGSLGKPMLGARVAVIDEEGRELPPRQVGQIAIWRSGGWVRIGDAAYVDDEGYFWYVSRMDDVIISSGYTIGPIEVEEALQKHPAVEECAVVGSPDPERGEIVKAFIKVRSGHEASEGLKREIQEFVRTRLSPHEYPREIEFIDEIPKTPDGKIKRKELKNLCRQAARLAAGTGQPSRA